jgi:acetyltransferase-like isoleucine patch superfamily enzyme
VSALGNMGMKENSQNGSARLLGSSRGVTRKDPLEWFSRAAGKLRTLWLARTYPFASFGRKAWVHYSCRVARSAAPYISIGENVGLARDARLYVSPNLGTHSPALILEENCGVGRWCVISARNRIHVMRDVLFGPRVLVMDHARAMEGDAVAKGGAQQPTGGTIRIEEDCWIGFGTVIVCEQGELVIGRRSVVGANSLVTRSIPPYSVVSGDPARIVKQYDFSQGKWVLGCIRPAARVGQEHPEPVGGAVS